MIRCVTNDCPDAIMRLEVKTMVGRNCKRLRQRAGLTQDALAERLHVTRQAVSAWETGKNQPDVETLAALAEALGADVRELIYGPGAVGEGYARFQRRYVVCTVLCATVVLAWLVLELTLKPYLREQYYYGDNIFRLYRVYLLAVPPLGCGAAGCLIPSFASLWADLRVRSARARRILLAAGLLALGYYLLWMTGILNLWPDAFSQCYPLRLWFSTLATVGNELLRLGPLFLAGGLLFLVLNR